MLMNKLANRNFRLFLLNIFKWQFHISFRFRSKSESNASLRDMRSSFIRPILGIFGLLGISEALNANGNLEETIQNSCWPLRRKDFRQSKLARNGNIQTIQLDINGVNFESEYLILLTDATEE